MPHLTNLRELRLVGGGSGGDARPPLRLSLSTLTSLWDLHLSPGICSDCAFRWDGPAPSLRRLTLHFGQQDTWLPVLAADADCGSGLRCLLKTDCLVRERLTLIFSRARWTPESLQMTQAILDAAYEMVLTPHREQWRPTLCVRLLAPQFYPNAPWFDETNEEYLPSAAAHWAATVASEWELAEYWPDPYDAPHLETATDRLRARLERFVMVPGCTRVTLNFHGRRPVDIHTENAFLRVLIGKMMMVQQQENKNVVIRIDVRRVVLWDRPDPAGLRALLEPAPNGAQGGWEFVC